MSFTSVKICELERWVSPNPSQGLICPQSSSCNFIQSAAFGEGGAQGEMVLGFLTRFILDQIKMVKIPQFFFSRTSEILYLMSMAVHRLSVECL